MGTHGPREFVPPFVEATALRIGPAFLTSDAATARARFAVTRRCSYGGARGVANDMHDSLGPVHPSLKKSGGLFQAGESCDLYRSLVSSP